jgi:hypothetical protein
MLLVNMPAAWLKATGALVNVLAGWLIKIFTLYLQKIYNRCHLKHFHIGS